ncbi:hypothetical protein [Corynebacterium callunae]|uniref:Uncharacterized protein n=1 Tax=Corynebacterium callunae DSM 20147 TaxID=1121353 RepID=M1ULE8_9CORY|nr:hypothetical protein [Corynebacterium callunae]AGG66904.1 hypothetical protein H924_07310 [Corynebacterium callunae DSM 20147]
MTRDKELHADLKYLLDHYTGDISTIARTALETAITHTTPPTLAGGQHLDSSYVTIINTLTNSIRWRGWTFKDRALIKDMMSQAQHLERRRAARHTLLYTRGGDGQ